MFCKKTTGGLSRESQPHIMHEKYRNITAAMPRMTLSGYFTATQIPTGIPSRVSRGVSVKLPNPTISAPRAVSSAVSVSFSVFIAVTPSLIPRLPR
jgi:hypothetical protein